MFLDPGKPLVENGLALVQLFGLPIALVSYWYQKHRDRRLAMFKARDAVLHDFSEYYKSCMENPDLDVFERPREQVVATLAGLGHEYNKETAKIIFMYSNLMITFEKVYYQFMFYEGGRPVHTARRSIFRALGRPDPWDFTIRTEDRLKLSRNPDNLEVNFYYWFEYIAKFYLDRKEFRAVWDMLKGDFDARFVEHIQSWARQIEDARRRSGGPIEPRAC